MTPNVPFDPTHSPAMKKSLLLGATLICATLASSATGVFAQAEPVQKMLSVTQMPAEVRARMSDGARTLSLLRLLPKTGMPPLLLHAWLVDKPSAPPPPMDEDTPEKLPFHLDFFYQRDSKWQLGTSVSYLSERPAIPLEYPEAVVYKARWLYPARKDGILIVEKTYLGSDSLVRLVTLPQGVPTKIRVTGAAATGTPNTSTAAPVQKFFQHNFGGQSASNLTFEVEAGGGTILVDDYRSVGEHTVTTYGWRGGVWKEIKKHSEVYPVPSGAK